MVSAVTVERGVTTCSFTAAMTTATKMASGTLPFISRPTSSHAVFISQGWACHFFLCVLSVMLTLRRMGQVGPPKVPENFMAPITAVPTAKAGDKARVEAILTELPEDVTAALIKKCAPLLTSHCKPSTHVASWRIPKTCAWRALVHPHPILTMPKWS